MYFKRDGTGTHTFSLFNDVAKTVLPVMGMQKFELVKIIRKILNNTSVHNLTLSYPNHSHDKRLKGLDVIRVRTEIRKKSMAYRGHTFNSISSGTIMWNL